MSAPQTVSRQRQLSAPGPRAVADAGGLLVPQRTPELELLMTCACRGEAAERVRSATAALLDWERLVALAEWHRLTPLLHWRLNAARAEVPKDVRASLAGAFLMNAGRVLELCAELVLILRMFESKGIKAVPYKGPALAAQLYGNVGLRMAGDLDIVVRPGDAIRAREVLLSLGYVPRHSIAAHHVPYLLRHRYSEEFTRGDALVVELHWAFTNGDVAFPVSVDELFTRLQRTELGGTAVPVFAPEDLLLLLAVHGAKHSWSRLEWVSTFGELARRASSVDAASLLTRSRRLHCHRRLVLGLRLAELAGGQSLPLAAPSHGTADRRARRLAGMIWPHAFEHIGRSSNFERAASVPSDLFQLQLSDSLTDRWRLIRFRFTTSTRSERWSTISFGTRAWSMPGLTRPLNVAVRLIPALWWTIASRRKALASAQENTAARR